MLQGQFNGGENGHVTEVVSLMERGGHFNGGRTVIIQRFSP